MKSRLRNYLGVLVLLVAANGIANPLRSESPTDSLKDSIRVEGDNSGVNERDRGVHEVTAENQAMNRSDTEITRLIRQELMRDDSLSTNAHNIKIITKNGRTTLKGPVETLEEKRKVVAAASKVQGEKPVIENIDITGR